MKPYTRVLDFMTPDPHFIELGENLAAAERKMKQLRVRQLPVMHEGKLRGTISERDVGLVRSLELDPREVGIAEALAFEPYTVSPYAPLARVVRAMAAHRYGCAIVVDRGKVRGILTTTDALRALAQLLDRYEPDPSIVSAAQLRAMLMSEHLHLRELLGLAIDRVREVLGGDASDEDLRDIRSTARSAYEALLQHTELEDLKLAPVLETIDAWGQVRADHLRHQHAAQRMALERALANLEAASPSDAVAMAALEDVLVDILRDIDREEAELLRSELLSEELVQPFTEEG